MAREPIRVLLVEDNPATPASSIGCCARRASALSSRRSLIYRPPFNASTRSRSAWCCWTCRCPTARGWERSSPCTPALSGDADRGPDRPGGRGHGRAHRGGRRQDYLVKVQSTQRPAGPRLALRGRPVRRQRCLEEARGSTEEDLKLARRVLDHFVLKGPPACAGVDMPGASFPAVTTSGDYFDYLPLGEGRVGSGDRRRDGQGAGSGAIDDGDAAPTCGPSPR